MILHIRPLQPLRCGSATGKKFTLHPALHFPYAEEVLQELVQGSHEVYYITARSGEYCERTMEWLNKNGFPVRGEHFYCGMADEEKVHIIESLKLREVYLIS